MKAKLIKESLNPEDREMSNLIPGDEIEVYQPTQEDNIIEMTTVSPSYKLRDGRIIAIAVYEGDFLNEIVFKNGEWTLDSPAKDAMFDLEDL